MCHSADYPVQEIRLRCTLCVCKLTLIFVWTQVVNKILLLLRRWDFWCMMCYSRFVALWEGSMVYEQGICCGTSEGIFCSRFHVITFFILFPKEQLNSYGLMRSRLYHFLAQSFCSLQDNHQRVNQVWSTWLPHSLIKEFRPQTWTR